MSRAPSSAGASCCHNDGMAEDAPRQALLVQERSRRTYQALADAARELWWERGFDDVRVSEICERAGVSKGSFYFYFPRKEDLLVELALASLDTVHERVLEQLAKGDEPKTVLRSTMVRISETAEAIPRHIVKRMNEETMRSMNRWEAVRGEHATFFDIFGAIFHAANQRGDLAGSYSSAEVGAMLSWAVVQAQHFWASGRAGEAELSWLLLRRAELLWNGASMPSVPSPRFRSSGPPSARA